MTDENSSEASLEPAPVAVPRKRGKKAAVVEAQNPADAAVEAALAEERQLANIIAEDATALSDPLPENSESPVIEMSSTEPAAEAEESVDAAQAIDPKELERTVEALLFAATEPISVRELARAADSNSAAIRKILVSLKETLDRERRPWDLVEIAGAHRLVTRPEFHSAIQRLKSQASQRKLTQAALETLALIAYRQPIGRAEIESVRGVNAGPVLRVLLEKKLIQISGRGTGVGQPLLYGTTDFFLENFGLKNIAELPKPGEFKNT